MIIIETLLFLLGLVVVWITVLSAIRTLVLPRSAPDMLTRLLFMVMRWLFEWRLHWAKTYRERDHIFAFYSPTAVLLLLPYWLTLILLGFILMNWATGIRPWSEAFTVSGSSLLTLGFARGDTFVQTVLAFVEATLGLILVALLIAYLPTMYSAFSRREQAVTLLEVWAGSPPSAVEMIARVYRIGGLARLNDFWETWESWFADVEESHTSLPALVFFRSPQPEQHWVTAAGTVLDTAALMLSIVDVPNDPKPALCLRAGYLALRHICDFFGTPYDSDPQFPRDSISITREEFETACDRLAAQNVPLKQDRDQAWAQYGGWRVNYDVVLLALSALTMAPQAAWISDRAPAFVVPPLFLGRN
jgi:hypothetical protein